MRWRVIVINVVIIVLVGVLAGALMWSQHYSNSPTHNQIVRRASQSLIAASAQIQLDSLQIERWLAAQAAASSMREPFEAAVSTARGESASRLANALFNAAAQTASLARVPPEIIAFVDVNGIALGRNGNNLMRGDNLAQAHPTMVASVKKGQVGSEIWYMPHHSQQWFVSFAPVISHSSEVLGAIIYGTPLNDGRMTQLTNKTGDGALAVMVQGPTSIDVPAKSDGFLPPNAQLLSEPKLAEKILASATENPDEQSSPDARKWVIVASLLSGFNGSKAVIVRMDPVQGSEIAASVFYPAVISALLGIVMVIITGWVLGNYISMQIRKMEDDLLQIVNGNIDLRLDAGHSVLGGLASRINSLINQFTGVRESSDDITRQPLNISSFSQTLQDGPDLSRSSQSGGADAVTGNANSAKSEPQYHGR